MVTSTSPPSRATRARSSAIGPVALGGGDADRHPRHGRAQGQRAPDVVGVADVGQVPALEVAEVLAQGQQVGEGLARVGPVGQEVDHGDAPGPLRRRGGHAASSVCVVEDPGADHGVVAGQGAGHVLGRLPGVDADLGALDVDGVAAEGDHGHLGGVAGAGRRLLEHEGRPPPGEDGGAAAGGRRPGPGPRRARRSERSSMSRKWRVMPPPPVAADRQHRAEDGHGLVDLLVGHEQRRGQADGVGPGRR